MNVKIVTFATELWKTMAKQAKKSPRKPEPKARKVRFAFFKSDKFRYTLAVTFMVLGVYMLIAFVSFLSSGAADQSKLDLPAGEFVGDATVKVQNSGGKTGAYLGEVLINQGFGLASFFFVFLFITTSLRLFGVKAIRFGKVLVFSVLLMFWMSTVLGMLFVDSESDQFLYLGGIYGLFFSSWLSAMLGTVGAMFALGLYAFVLAVAGISNFIPWMKNLFSKPPKPENENLDDVPEPAMAGGFTAPVQPVEDNAISKVITEEDHVKAVFDPDSFNDDDLEVENTISAKDIAMSIESRMKSDGRVAKEPEMEVEQNLNPEMHVEEPEADDEEYPNPPAEDYDPTLDLSSYKYPTIDLLDEHSSGNAEVSNEELISNKNKIVETLRHYKIEITKIRATIGPTITLYEIVPAPGIRIAKIKNLEDDIALSLAALGIRIIAPIPGRGTIGIEVPNQKPEVVSMRSIIGSKKFQESNAELPIALGKTISNETYMVDLAKMPHILVAGATGQGKSVGLNAIITSLLYKKHPSQLKFVLVDPKKVELTLYSTLEKHFLAKMPDEEEAIISDIQKVKNTLNSLTVEMDTRYDLLKKAHTRNIIEYNAKFISRRLNPEKGHRYLPYIVVIVDEFADLIMTAGKEVELPIARIAQLARAVGIHMIIATQRPSTNIITGVIKANFPARIAFKVASMIDSRTILDTPGANQLIGKGDMLISAGSAMTRVQCAFVDTPEVERVCQFIAEQKGYPTAFMLPDYVGDTEDGGGALDADLANRDEMFDDAARLVVLNQMGSTSMIQRKFAIGYNRAGRIMDQLEAAGVVGPSEGSKARQVLIQDEYTLEQLLNSL